MAGLFAFWLGRAIQSGRLTVRRTPLDAALLAMTAAASLSALLAVNRPVAVYGLYLRYEGLLTICTYCLLFWLVAQSLTGAGEARSVVRALLASGYVLALLAIAQLLLAGRTAGADTPLTFDGWDRVDATFGNPFLLATYLAMLLPLAVWEAMSPESALGRALAVNATVVMAAALVLTFSRGAWLGAAAGLAIAVVPLARRSAAVRRVALAAAAGTLAVAVATATGAGPPLLATVWSRAASLVAPLQGSGGARVAIWHDTLAMVAARPLAGWGPDTFGLVYPTFRSAGSAGVIDKAHSDLLQVAATQGLVGVAATLLALVALLAAFWRGTRTPGAVALLGALAAYEVSVQFEFAWVPVTAPFWILAAAATTAWAGARPPRALVVAVPMARAVRLPLAVAAALLTAAVAALLAAMPFAADALSLQGMAALAAGDVPVARARIAEARLLAPYESTYRLPGRRPAGHRRAGRLRAAGHRRPRSGPGRRGGRCSAIGGPPDEHLTVVGRRWYLGSANPEFRLSSHAPHEHEHEELDPLNERPHSSRKIPGPATTGPASTSSAISRTAVAWRAARSSYSTWSIRPPDAAQPHDQRQPRHGARHRQQLPGRAAATAVPPRSAAPRPRSARDRAPAAAGRGGVAGGRPCRGRARCCGPARPWSATARGKRWPARRSGRTWPRCSPTAARRRSATRRRRSSGARWGYGGAHRHPAPQATANWPASGARRRAGPTPPVH
ncbi:MAG: hypothetical protein E6J41_33655 [Chloroflexi bacterium]|nr:MAG: hypothetical protein E6J41_33655 [Chloroflexota bacterium]